MLVRFIKYCPWSIKGKVVKYLIGTTKEVLDEDGELMVQHGYAEKVIKEDKPAPAKTTVITSLKDADFDDDERFIFYKTNYSLQKLKDFCEEHGVVIKTNQHRTIPTIIDQIIAHEKEHGLLIESEKNE